MISALYIIGAVFILYLIALFILEIGQELIELATAISMLDGKLAIIILFIIFSVVLINS